MFQAETVRIKLISDCETYCKVMSEERTSAQSENSIFGCIGKYATLFILLGVVLVFIFGGWIVYSLLSPPYYHGSYYDTYYSYPPAAHTTKVTVRRSVSGGSHPAPPTSPAPPAASS